MAMESPLPVRNGVNATRLRLPRTGSWATVADYLLERFGHVDPEGILRRFDEQQIVGLGGTPLTRQTPLGEHEFIWYYRSLPEETPIPFEARILYQDEHLLVVDKPHFLPTTPGGRFIQESALVRLRNQTGIDDLVPMHRLDRATAGVGGSGFGREGVLSGQNLDPMPPARTTAQRLMSYPRSGRRRSSRRARRRGRKASWG